MTFPLLGKSYFFACAAIAAQSREARCKNSRSAERGCSSVYPPPNRRRMGGGSNLAPPPTGYRRAIARSAVQKQPERRALRPQARFGAQPPQAALGAEIGCSSVTPPPNRRRMGGGDNLALLLGKAANPAPPPTSYRRAKLALNVRIGCSYRAHNHHKFSHRILQPHTKRRASHAD